MQNGKKKVLIVASETCVQCKNLKRELEGNYFDSVDLEYIMYGDLENQPNLLDEVNNSGLKSFPMIRLNGEWIPTSVPQKFLSQHL